MTLILQLIQGAGKTSTVLEDTFLAVGSLAAALEAGFAPYIQAFLPFLYPALKAHQATAATATASTIPSPASLKGPVDGQVDVAALFVADKATRDTAAKVLASAVKEGCTQFPQRLLPLIKALINPVEEVPDTVQLLLATTFISEVDSATLSLMPSQHMHQQPHPQHVHHVPPPHQPVSLPMSPRPVAPQLPGTPTMGHAIPHPLIHLNRLPPYLHHRPHLPQPTHLALTPTPATLFLEDNLSEVAYPEGIKSPKVELNANVRDGRFRVYAFLAVYLPQLTLRGHSAAITRLMHSPTKHLIYSASLDSSIHIWALPSPSRTTYAPYDDSSARGELVGHTDAVWDLALVRDENALVSRGAEGSIKVWDVGGAAEGRAILRMSWGYYGLDHEGSEKEALAVFDWSYQMHSNTFHLALADGRQILCYFLQHDWPFFFTCAPFPIRIRLPTHSLFTHSLFHHLRSRSGLRILAARFMIGASVAIPACSRPIWPLVSLEMLCTIPLGIYGTMSSGGSWSMEHWQMFSSKSEMAYNSRTGTMPVFIAQQTEQNTTLTSFSTDNSNGEFNIAFDDAKNIPYSSTDTAKGSISKESLPSTPVDGQAVPIPAAPSLSGPNPDSTDLDASGPSGTDSKRHIPAF
ncbi:hypothetical protein CY34DRAFT_15435 [Suillus luteus UH-Slu-Lm8-n1]|uniref:Importin subunit beta-1/Transportin-1-like TPR repeats domain-containing protein n=1 Tax=Suillus luteus UH-Slu-Lm8-n1 TaxID=930992 RepID=A0A0D0AI81_9AGAM|nr:hypothetical protein CY34DRAFT_15435 [Suillus luteus UH-Slu-Lm8-n1]